VEGVEYTSISSAAKAYSLKPDTVMHRLDSGFIADVAFLMPPRQGRRLMNELKRNPDVDQIAFLNNILKSSTN